MAESKISTQVSNSDLMDDRLQIKLDKFMARTGHPRNEWLEGRYLKVYVRKSHWREYPGSDGHQDSLELASFQIYQEEDERKGYARSFIRHVIEKCHESKYYIFIENVLDQVWMKKLQRDHNLEPLSDYCLWLKPF